MTPERERQVAQVISAAKQLEEALACTERFTSEASGAVVMILPASDLREFEAAMVAWRKWCRENPHG
jgi:hypothetical protein